MFNLFGNSMSAVRAYTRGLMVSAHNVANAETENFKPQRATYSSAPGGGVVVDVQTAQEAPGTDLSEEAVNMISSERAIEANLAVMRHSDKTLGVLIDTVA